MSLEERLAAVERTLTHEETPPAALDDAATVDRRLSDVETRQRELETRLADLEAAVDGLRGRAGADRSERRTAEQTAERALATAREVEDRLADEALPPRTTPVVREPSDLPREPGDQSGVLDRLRSWL